MSYFDAADRDIADVNFGTAGAGMVQGTATGGSSTTLVDMSLPTTSQNYAGYTLMIVSGPGVGQKATVSGYSSTTQTLTINGSFATPVGAGSAYLLVPIGYLEGTATGGSTTTLTDTTLPTTGQNYTGDTLMIIGGPGAGQSATVAGYSSSTKTLTINGSFGTTVGVGSAYLLVPTGHALSTATAGSTTTLTDTTLPTTSQNYTGYTLAIIGGLGAGQRATVLSYSPGSRTLTISGSFTTAVGAGRSICFCPRGWSRVPPTTRPATSTPPPILAASLPRTYTTASAGRRKRSRRTQTERPPATQIKLPCTPTTATIIS